MKFLFVSLFFSPLVAFGQSPISPNNQPERLILSLAEKTFIPFPFDQKIRVGDKSLIAFQTHQGHISLLARKEGRTILSAGSKRYEIFIFNQEDKLKALKLDSLLKQFLGLTWTLSKDQVFQVTGTLQRLSDWVELAKLSKENHISYQFKAVIGEDLKPVIQYYFKNILESQAYFKNYPPPDVIWKDLPLALFPKGADFLEYQKIFQPFGLELKEDPLWFNAGSFIGIDIAVVESLSSSGLSFGGASPLESVLQGFSFLLDFLNFLKNSGQGKTLMKASLRGQSGQELSLQSGGQIPFNSFNFKTEQNSTEWKEYGLNIKLTPRLDKKKQIALDISVQISEPLSVPTVSGLPPLKTQSWKSQVILRDGQIVPLFHQKKRNEGLSSQGQMGFLSASSFLRGSNIYKNNQMIFIQVKVLKPEEDTSQEENNLFLESQTLNFKDKSQKERDMNQ